jgi:hypothetical protein
MSTSSTRQSIDVAAAAAANAEAREARIAAAEPIAQQVAEMARAVVATAEATIAAATALHEEDADDRDGARPRGPHRRRNVSP